jgi:hypothetical protein
LIDGPVSGENPHGPENVNLLGEDGKNLRSHIKQKDLGEGWRRRCTGGRRRTLLVDRRIRQAP